jgi:hypothetical protein
MAETFLDAMQLIGHCPMRYANLLPIMTGGLPCLCAAGALAQPNPMMDQLAGKLVQKYQASSCQQIAEQRAHPPTGPLAEIQAGFVHLLHENPGMRQEFLNRVAAPIANTLFKCGMIP